MHSVFIFEMTTEYQSNKEFSEYEGLGEEHDSGDENNGGFNNLEINDVIIHDVLHSIFLKKLM